ncbi:30S ribosomal protein S5 [Candidatus Uhrbacteria bacterium]|nr:30S ribosomal protein S5 [Candidatus Uhrbacteria bacterium]
MPGQRGQRRGPRRDGPQREEGGDELEQKVLDLSRVTRVTAGGKRMRFRACIAIGDGRGHVGVGLAKGADVSSAIAKATTKAKKEMLEVPIVHETIPYDIIMKFKAAKVLLKPAPKGTGIIAGGVVRLILILAGVPNVAAKMLGSSNRVTNAKATMAALAALRARAEIRRTKSEIRNKLE